MQFYLVVNHYTYKKINLGKCVMCTWNQTLFFKLSLKVFEFEKKCQNHNYMFKTLKNQVQTHTQKSH